MLFIDLEFSQATSLVPVFLQTLLALQLQLQVVNIRTCRGMCHAEEMLTSRTDYVRL